VNATRAVARVASAALAKVLDAGIAGDGRAYVVSEHVVGQTLGQRLAGGRLSQTQVADVVAQIARALLAAQGVGVVHHDLKPANVLLVPDEDRATGERAVVLDFGLAPLVAARLERAASAYIAPELWSRGEQPTDGAADVYALGCLAFQLAVGRPPFQAPTHEKMREKHLHDPAPSVRSLAPDTGVVLDRLVARMLEKRPADRPPSVQDLAKLFDLLVGQEAPLGETVHD
jgi:serine/threonine-protein kinase